MYPPCSTSSVNLPATLLPFKKNIDFLAVLWRSFPMEPQNSSRTVAIPFVNGFFRALWRDMLTHILAGSRVAAMPLPFLDGSELPAFSFWVRAKG